MVHFGDGGGDDGDGGASCDPRLGRGVCWLHPVSGVGVSCIGRGGFRPRCRGVLVTSLGRSLPRRVVSWATSTLTESSSKHHNCALHAGRSSLHFHRRGQLSGLRPARLSGRAAYFRPGWPPPATPNSLEWLLWMRSQMIFADRTCTEASVGQRTASWFSNVVSGNDGCLTNVSRRVFARRRKTLLCEMEETLLGD